MVKIIGKHGTMSINRRERMTRNESHVLRFERCPACARLGNDRSGDNLAVYSDGHTYCFRCGHGSGRTKIQIQNEDASGIIGTNSIVLPHDVSSEIPYAGLQWLRQYQLTRRDLIANHVMWSEKLSRIIFPYFDQTGLLAWQGRYIGEEKKAKWFSQGNIHEIIHTLNVKHTAVLVEDIISAIKVSQHTGAIPIFGSSISMKQWLQLRRIVNDFVLWLDPDMRQKSIKMAEMGRLLGANVVCIFSEKDPKEHTHEEIDKLLETV